MNTDTTPATTDADDRAYLTEGFNSPATKMLFALGAKSRRDGGTIYEGTVPAAVKARRRSANRTARRSRATNRRAS